MRIVAADSGAAILNDKFEPVTVVAAVATLTEPPYKRASSVLAEPILAEADKGYQKNIKLKLGLPIKCHPQFFKDKIALQSLMPTEKDVVGYAECNRDVLESVQIVDMLNHYARGFEMVEINPTQQ